MSELLLDRAGRRRSPATMPGFHAGHAPGNKGLRYPADPPKVEEIIAVMRTAGDASARPPPTRTDRDHVARGAAHPGSARSHRGRSRSPPRLTAGPARQGRAPSRGRHGRMGLGTAPAVARAAARAPGRSAAVRHQRRDARTPLVACRGTRRAAAHRRRGRSAAPLRAAPAPPRPRRRDGPRRRAADRHPTPTRPQQPRHHLRLPAGHRQRRDHRDRARPTRTDDPRQRLAAAAWIVRDGRCLSRKARSDAVRAQSFEASRAPTSCPRHRIRSVEPHGRFARRPVVQQQQRRHERSKAPGTPPAATLAPRAARAGERSDRNP